MQDLRPNRAALLALTLIVGVLAPGSSLAALVADGRPIGLPAVTAATGASGDLELAWTQASGSTSDLLAQHLDATGTPTAPPISLARVPASSYFVPKVAALANGGFAVAWEVQQILFPWSSASTPAAGSIWACLLDGGGQPHGEAVPLSSDRIYGMRIAPLAGGGFAAMWTGSLSGLVARRFDGTGQPLGAEIPLQPTYAPQGIGLFGLADGGLLAAWFGTASTLLVQRFDAADVAVGPRVTLASPSFGQPFALAASGSGRMVVGWMVSPYGPLSRALLQVFDVSGQALSPILTLAEANPTGSPLLRDLAMDIGGRFVALWDRSPFAGLSSVNARLFDPSGLALGDEIVLNRETGNNHGSAVLPANDGTWGVVWSGAFAGTKGDFFQRLNGAACGADGGSLCLGGDRFAASVAFHDPASGEARAGHPVPLGDGTGALWFFDPQNPELIVKLIDGAAVNGHHWLFYASLTDVEFDLTVVDHGTGAQRVYHNPAGTLASVADTQAFAGGAASARSAPTPITAVPARSLARAETIGSGSPSANVCHFEPETLCLNQSRFRASVTWRDPRSGRTGAGQAVQRSTQGGDFWFFGPDDVELAVKILDGTAVNGHVWVFYASLTDVEFDLTVEDSASPGGTPRTYHNPPYHLASAADTQAF